MMAGKHLNRATIGPNTDTRLAMVALARDILDREARALADAESDALNAQLRKPVNHLPCTSVHALKRAAGKARARTFAAQNLYEMAVAHSERRAYIFHDATQTPGASNLTRETAEVALESSGENQAPSDEFDEGDQATVTPGNCACVRYPWTSITSGLTIYGHHPACRLPLPSINPDLRLWWPVAHMQGSGM